MNVQIKDIFGKTICEVEANSENDFSGVDLSGKNLQFADLHGKNLEDANLEWAILKDANLEEAILKNANLKNANLRWAIGNGKEIKTIRTDQWTIVIAEDQMAIGCQQHSLSDWMNFSDEEIEEMDGGALDWCKKWKPIIQAMIAD